MLTNEKINEVLGVEDSYKAPENLMEILLEDEKRQQVFNEFLSITSDLSKEWFQGYFEAEHADRKNKKQDFTPSSASQICAEIAGASDRYFEAAAGTGGMMIQYWNNNQNAFFEVEELSDRAIPFLLFNMSIRKMTGIIRHGDSLKREFKEIYNIEKGQIQKSADGPSNLKANVVMNPPFSAQWEQKNDERFNNFGLAPKSKADFAFLLHGYHHLKSSGRMAIILPHGVLFRGAAEGKIRKTLLENGAIDAVIGLPANIFYGTSIPTTIIVLQKDRTTKDVLFIDASNDFTKEKNQNSLEEKHIKKILDVYRKRESVEKYAHVASFENIEENDFNLNIPRYVDTFEEEEAVDILEVMREMIEIDKQIAEAESDLCEQIGQLTSQTEDMSAIIEASRKLFQKN
ncbi:TPA: N-6 DNA methylase [Listeria monocytogenes]|uniref:N-6 DNA methylase n=2 Tax=Listeria seeligeri TaxID=1640 RepID=UPI0016284B36|nr:N-6 DNA methylase [Listeria seeligeri]MBC1586071.1 N-6 DNA methylase [Listeria seeligeri]MBC2071792.1 N-6 DNA methylase [Listeria seeligeri]HBK3089390.1 N-6 DNA methylase [Listeria monocytogenes]